MNGENMHDINDILEDLGLIKRKARQRVRDRLVSMSRRLANHIKSGEVELEDWSFGSDIWFEAILTDGDPNGDGKWQLAATTKAPDRSVILRGNPGADPLLSWRMTLAPDDFWEVEDMEDLRPVPPLEKL